MTYNNLETQVTSVSGTWNGTAISFSTLGLSTSIPFKDQIEVERIFSSSAFTAVKDNITTSDLHKIFLLEKTEYTITGNTISAFSMNSTRSYTLTGGSSSGTAIPIPAISNGDSVIIRRKTLSMDTYVTWAPGTKLTTTQLNQQVGQLLRLNQELIYKLDTEYVRAADLSGSVAPVLAVNNNLNMNSYQILNLATPASAVGSDTGAGVNKGYVDTNFVNKSTAQTGIAGAKTFTGAITLSSTLAVTGAVTLSSGLTVDTNTLVVDATNDRVGIGTASPDVKLHVVGAAGVISKLQATNVIQAMGYIGAGDDIAYTGTLSNHPYAIITNNVQRMVIGTGGNVGIGTGSPSTKLTIAVPSTGTTLTGTDRYGGIHLTQNNTNDEFTGITTACNSTSTTTQAGILFQGSGAYGSKIHFLTTDFFDVGMKNRMTLNHLGNLGIGTVGPSFTLDVVGTGRFSSSTNDTKLLVQGYGNALAYGIQFTPTNDDSTFPCRFLNAAGTLVGSIQTTASTTIFNGTVNGSVMGNIGTTIVVTVPALATALTATATSGFCSKAAASNVVTLPSGTWIGYAINMSAAGVISSIANIPATSGAITCTGLTGTNLVNLNLMRSS